MALTPSSLSLACRSIADFVSAGLDAAANSIRVMIGSPVDAVPGQSDTEHRVNLFFYRIEPGGIYPDSGPGDTWWVRLHCLVTGFGLMENQISSGENDLRLLGEVMRLFHETPVLPALQVGDEAFRLQSIFQPLSPDDLNHIWSTQGDVHYRPSVVYEMALAPMVPGQRPVPPPLVGALGFEARAEMAARHAPFGGQAAGPPVRAMHVDIRDFAWAPRLCFVHQGACSESLAFAEGSAEFAAFQARVWVAGDPAATVTLVWELWTSRTGWQRASTQDVSPTTQTIDPDQTATASTVVFSPPFGGPGQALLYAERTFAHPGTGQALTVRSNPLLVTLYAVSP